MIWTSTLQTSIVARRVGSSHGIESNQGESKSCYYYMALVVLIVPQVVALCRCGTAGRHTGSHAWEASRPHEALSEALLLLLHDTNLLDSASDLSHP